MGSRVFIKRKEALVFLFIIMVVVLSVLCVTIKVSASQENTSTIQVKSIMVESGDTLWDIATANYSDNYDSIEEYVDVIKDCNHITSDKIFTGSYLIIPYYQ